VKVCLDPHSEWLSDVHKVADGENLMMKPGADGETDHFQHRTLPTSGLNVVMFIVTLVT